MTPPRSGKPERAARKTRPTSRKEVQRRKREKKQQQSFIKLKRSLRLGGATTVRYTKEAVGKVAGYVKNAAEQEDMGQPSWLSRVHLTFPLFVIITLIVLAIALLALDNSSIRVDRQTVSVVGLPKDLEGYTILQLSDLHGRRFGGHQSTLLRTINSASYNAVVMTGDMVGRSGDAQPLYELLEGMTAKRPVLFIAGDSDPGPLLTQARATEGTLVELVLADWILGAQDRGAIYLNAPYSVTVGQSTLWFSPEEQLSVNVPEQLSLINTEVRLEQEGVLEGDEESYHNLPFSEYFLNTFTQLQQAANTMKNEDIHIALAHYPPTVDYIRTIQEQSSATDTAFLRPVDLVLAGHYCGGGWKLPFYGALFVPAPQAERYGWLPTQNMVDGLSALGGTNLYISPGLGVTDRIWLPKFRVFNTPTVSLITLTSALNEDMLGGDIQ